jgi:ketosteroid isomerase-like protein
MIDALVAQLYTALAGGDRATVEALISPDFVAEFSAGYGEPVGGRHVGADAIDSGWWALGRRWAVRAHPEEQIATVDGRLLVLGHYRGRPRSTPDAEPFDAAFAHLWSAEGDRLTTLVQITDTAIWLAEPTVGQPATT